MSNQHRQQTSEHRFVRPGQVAPDHPAPDRCMECSEPFGVHALRAVLEALDIPHPATVGDGEVHDKIVAERTMHAVLFLRNLLDEPTIRPERELDYFRGKLAEHPATGYRIWDDAVAEHNAQEQAKMQMRRPRAASRSSGRAR